MSTQNDATRLAEVGFRNQIVPLLLAARDVAGLETEVPLHVRLDDNISARPGPSGGGKLGVLTETGRRTRRARVLVRALENRDYHESMMNGEIASLLEIAGRYDLVLAHSNAGMELSLP